MSQTILTQSASKVQSTTTKVVYEYAFTLINPQDNDTQEVTAAFASLPTIDDWQQWLTGWNSCGYILYAPPLLINVI